MTRNPGKWTKIGDTVREAQDILARLCWNQRPALVKRVIPPLGGPEMCMWTWPRVTMPQSLGELCIELAQDKYLGWQMDIEDGLIWVQSDDPESENWLKNPDQIHGFGTETRRDIQDLRRVMYHRNIEKEFGPNAGCTLRFWVDYVHSNGI